MITYENLVEAAEIVYLQNKFSCNALHESIFRRFDSSLRQVKETLETLEPYTSQLRVQTWITLSSSIPDVWHPESPVFVGDEARQEHRIFWLLLLAESGLLSEG